MYFYTGPGGAASESPINIDDDEETVKVGHSVDDNPGDDDDLKDDDGLKDDDDREDDDDHGYDDDVQVKEKQAESARKSGRANKGKIKERADKIVEMPQAKVGHKDLWFT